MKSRSTPFAHAAALLLPAVLSLVCWWLFGGGDPSAERGIGSDRASAAATGPVLATPLPPDAAAPGEPEPEAMPAAEAEPLPAREPLRMDAFTRRIAAAASRGVPLRIAAPGSELGEVRVILTPRRVLADEFQVTLGAEKADALPMELGAFGGRVLQADGALGGRAVLAVAGDKLAAEVELANGDTLLLRSAPEGDPGDVRAIAVKAGAEIGTCAIEPDPSGGEMLVGVTRATEGSDPITEGDWEAAAAAEIEPDIMAAGGVDPETGRLDKYIEQIGYGQHYDASLKDMYQLVVLDKDATGGDSTGNLMAKTSEYIARIASFAGIQEHQVGVRVLLQELILTPNTGDYSDVSESLGGFRDWVGSNRSRGTYGWHVASKFGLIGASGGTIGIAYVSAISGGSGVSVNRPGYTVALVAHETGHNQGSGHSSGGIMNSGLIGGTRDYYTDVSEGRTAAKAIYDVTKDRIAGSAAMRHAAQIPWANDDARSTAAGAAHTFNPLNNDAASVRHGSNNSVLKLEEVGRVWPLWAGEAAIDGDQIVFTPEPGYQGIAYFSYTLRGDVGNGGQGWLHKGDVSVKVGSFNANSLDLELGAGQHFSFRPSGGDPDIRTQPAQAWVGTSRDDRRLIIIHADATASGTDSFVFRQDGADKTVNITYRGDYFQARPDFIVADPTAGAIRLNPMLNDQAAGYRNYASTYPVVGANSGGAQTNAYYFRREFPALNAAAITGLTIELLRDDGAVIYLNGTEVARDNMPAGPVDYATEASAAVGGGDESAYQTINIGAGALVEGTNLIAVEVHQAGATSSDLGFDLALKAARSGGGTETLIERNSRWRYYQDGDEPAADWETPAFGDGGSETNVGYGPDSSNKYPTTYFRAKFTPVIPAAAITGATLRIRRDDGAVVYLNGAEIARDNMPSGAIAHTTFAAGTASDDGDDWHEFSVAPAAILAGENVIAAEVHQASGTSSDITFDCELIAQTAGGDVALIPAGAEWRYLDDGSNQGTAWRGAGFADAAWATGPAPLGYPFSTGGWDQGDGVLGFGDDHIDTGLNKGGGGERYFPGAFEFISATNLSTDKGSLSLESRRFVLDRTPTDVLTGGMTFTPNADATGVATIEYTVRDASGETQTNTVSIILPLCEITSPAADPVAVDLDNGLVLEGVAFGGGQAPLSGVVDLEWSLASAPAGGQVIFDDATAERTGARFTKAGTYVLRLTGSDSGYATEDEVTVQVASRGLGAPGDSLFGWWRFDDTNTSDPADSSGNNRPGSRQDFANDAEGWGDGIIGGALTFDPGDTEYVRLRMYSDDLQPLAEGALSVWFRTNTGSDRTIFGASSTAGNPRDMRLYVEGGKLRFQMRGIGGIDETPLSSGSDVNDNNWHHAAAVAQSDGLVRLFLDGNEVAAGVRGFFADVGGLDRAAIGRTTEGGTGVSYFRGQLDDLRLYTRPLTRAEVEAIANSSGAGAPVVALPNATPTAPGATFNLGLLGAQIADSDPVAAHWAVAGGPGAASFSNAASLGSNVTFTAVGDYTLRLEADDGTAASFDDITITYTGQGSAFPVALGIEDRIVPQDGAAEQVDLFAAFEDASTPDSGLVFSVVGNTNPALFSAIQVVPGSPARLSLAFSGPEGSADLTVRAADAQGNATDTTFTVTVQNFAPQIAAQSFVINENPEVGTVAGTVRAADPDGDAVRYLIVGGNEAGVFALDANTGSLSVARAAPLNFELNESFALTVAAIDAANLDLGNTATITVHVTDLAEPPLIADQSFTVFEGTPIGTDLGAVIASDPDGGGALTFSVVGGDIGAAGIIADTGVLWLATGSLDVEAKPRYNIVVRARDESGLTADATVYVTVARKLVAEGANARYRIPANDAEDAIWRAASFNDSAWALGAMGIGYDEESDYDGEIQTDVEPAMAGVNETIYLRIPFSLAQPAAFGSLRLRVKYDDGFVAYLNGTEIARRNAAGALGWDAGASANHADGDAVQFEEIEADAFAPALVAGQNVLAIHGLNAGLGSSDFLLSAELIATGGGTAAAPNPPAAQVVDASQITPTTARLRGEVASDGGGAPVQVTIAWGLDDAGPSPGSWEHAASAGQGGAGTYVADAASLAPDTDYFFRVFASNAGGIGASEAGTFRTAALPERVLLTVGSPARAWVPDSATDAFGWQGVGFDDSAWKAGANGAGYDRNPDYAGLIGIDLESEMYDRRTSAYLRIPFAVIDPADIASLTLRMKYDDGYIAYLNGVEVARRNAPAAPAWNAQATGDHPDDQALIYEDELLAGAAALLLPGENVLALHGLNRGATSSDFLIQPQLVAADNRGPYAAWAIDAHGLFGFDALADADPDGDGVTNAGEFAFGGNPKFADAEALAPALDRQPDGAIRLAYRRRIGAVADGVSFAAEVSGDLNAWQRATGVSTISVLPAGDGETEIVTLRIPAGQGEFARVAATF